MIQQQSDSALNPGEFSFRTRERSLQRFRSEVFDLLVIGGGITGAAVARDATSRGLKVALVERNDFAFGTSSRSSKLIHGGLRYLQNLELGLVFEALAERSRLLKSVPHLVKPLPFYLPVYQESSPGRTLLSLGLWLYDLLALFRTPGFHKGLSKQKLLSEIPFLRSEGLTGGFRYFDASMWDDVLAVETLKSASSGGAAVANYTEAIAPLWKGNQVAGFRVRDREVAGGDRAEMELKALRTVVCAGPWTDQVGEKLSGTWARWLKPSKGVHLIFDLKRLPVPGAVVMTHPEDGRVSFVIPRPDYGTGVAIVGTTDGPTDDDPEKSEIKSEDIQYLLDLARKYSPSLNLTSQDVISAYVGVRPLMGDLNDLAGSEGQKASGKGGDSATVLQKVSREHHIARGPGGTVVVAGGKYTTHRRMAEEIVDFTLKAWKEDAHKDPNVPTPNPIGKSNTLTPVSPYASPESVEKSRREAKEKKLTLSEKLIDRYGSGAVFITEIEAQSTTHTGDPEGFPCLESQLRYCIRTEMVMHLEDFYLRRVPLFSTRRDHGLPWAKTLVQVWAEERGLGAGEVQKELDRLEAELARRSKLG